jgi:opacity protein-like surface antigen
MQMRFLILLRLLTLQVSAADERRTRFAVKIGVPFTGWFQPFIFRESADDRSNAWTLGPALEFGLTDRVAIEAGALYRRIGRDAGGGSSPYGFTDRERGYTWEFPLVGKYPLPFQWKAVNPFVSAGLSFELERTHTDSTRTSFTTNPDGTPGFFMVASKSAESHSNEGFTAGLGAQPKVGPVSLIMESRYTRWFKHTACSQVRGSLLRCVGF